jgi:hypothetical protein
VASGPDNSVWTGGATNKLFKYTGNWNTLDIPSGIYFISAIAVNHENSVWLGSEGIFCNYYAGNWTVYDESITGIPDTAVGYVFDIEFDYSGNTWIGHSKGLIKYDGSEWTTYSPENSGLLSEHIQALSADELGNLWIGTADTGLIAYQQGGVVKIEEEKSRSENRIDLLDPYPNPSRETITIPFEVAESSYIHISIRDVYGREVRSLFDGTAVPGSHSIRCSLGTKGVYFIQLISNNEVYSRKIILH